MTSSSKSTLSEVNKEFVKLVYAILNSLDSSRWDNPKRVFYITEPGWENLTYEYGIRNNQARVSLPVATVTRNKIEVDYGNTNRPFFMDMVHPVVATKGLHVRQATLGYDVRVYEYYMEEIERVVDHLSLYVLTRHESHSYNSAVLGISDMRFAFDFDLPEISLVGSKEKIEGKGYVYEMTVNVRVYTLVGRKTEDSNLITSYVLNLAQNLDENDFDW